MSSVTAAAGAQKKKRSRSLATRVDIIEATIDCFVEIGYVRTTTTEIAKKAGVTRGAVQHYFPTTPHVLEASIEYLQEKWMENYFALVQETPPGADYIDGAVDNMWSLVNSRIFVAWMELVAAARTDPDLCKIIRPSAEAYEKARQDVGRRAYPDFVEAGYEKFQLLRDTLRFLLEGMALSMITFDKERRQMAQLEWIKQKLHEEWKPEAGKVQYKD